MSGGTIRGLTLWRPWPSCFLLPELADGTGPKRVENRSWVPRKHVGPMVDGIAPALDDAPLYLALHAGNQRAADALEDLRAVGWTDLDYGEAGQIVAVCRLARVLDVETLGAEHPDVARHGIWICGRYAWEVDEVLGLREPVSCTGARGLWPLPGDGDTPRDVYQQVRAGWLAAARARRAA